MEKPGRSRAGGNLAPKLTTPSKVCQFLWQDCILTLPQPFSQGGSPMRSFATLCLAALVVLILAACSTPPTATPAPTVAPEPTATTLIAATSAPTEAPTPTPFAAPTATPTALPTLTPTSASTATPAPLPQLPQYLRPPLRLLLHRLPFLRVRRHLLRRLSLRRHQFPLLPPSPPRHRYPLHPLLTHRPFRASLGLLMA